MKNEPTKNGLKIFEQIKKIDENGNEFWNARDLAKILEYSEFRHFLPVINKAQESCQNSNYKVSNHFEHILEMVELGSGAKREIENFKLSRYACYLIDPLRNDFINSPTFKLLTNFSLSGSKP